MDESFKIEQHRGRYTIKAYYDECQEFCDPRQWDNLGTMSCFHRGYVLGDGRHKTVEDLREELKELQRDNQLVEQLPCILYDHSGISMSTSRHGWPFNCPWDAGQVGIIYCTREDVKRIYGWTRITKARRKKILDSLRDEVKIYSAYLEGEVYGFVITDFKGDYVDSCGGYLQDVDYMMKEAHSVAEWHRKHNLKGYCGQKLIGATA